jgi:hypothetical protein
MGTVLNARVMTLLNAGAIIDSGRRGLSDGPTAACYSSGFSFHGPYNAVGILATELLLWFQREAVLAAGASAQEALFSRASPTCSRESHLEPERIRQ